MCCVESINLIDTLKLFFVRACETLLVCACWLRFVKQIKRLIKGTGNANFVKLKVENNKTFALKRNWALTDIKST